MHIYLYVRPALPEGIYTTLQPWPNALICKFANLQVEQSRLMYYLHHEVRDASDTAEAYDQGGRGKGCHALLRAATASWSARMASR